MDPAPNLTHAADAPLGCILGADNDTAPLFSVVIPFEFHRGQWERCMMAWMAQTFERSRYEVILMVPSATSGATGTHRLSFKDRQPLPPAGMRPSSRYRA